MHNSLLVFKFFFFNILSELISKQWQWHGRRYLVQCLWNKTRSQENMPRLVSCECFRDFVASRNLTWSSQSWLQMWQKTVFQRQLRFSVDSDSCVNRLCYPLQSLLVWSKPGLTISSLFTANLKVLPPSAHCYQGSHLVREHTIHTDYLKRANVMREIFIHALCN